jgi:PAS domain S-box-containing protein
MRRDTAHAGCRRDVLSLLERSKWTTASVAEHADDRDHAHTELAGENHPLEMIASGRPLPEVLRALGGFFEAVAADWKGREAELRRSEAFLAQAQRLTKTGSLSWKPSTGEVTWSEENYRIMEYPVGVKPTVEMAIDRCHPDDLALVEEKLSTAIRDGAAVDFEHRLLMPNGTVKHVRVVFQNVAFESGEPEFIGAATDITEWKHAEEKLRKSEAYLTDAQRLSLTGSFGWRVGEDCHFWSDETFRIFGYDRSAPVTLGSLLERVHPQDQGLVQELFTQAEGGRAIDHECRLLMPDGTVKHAHIVAHRVRDRNGQLEIIGALQDVTQQRRSEEALGTLRSELAHVARVTSLGALTASIAHEVNQPLSGIITNASTCLRLLAADPPNVDGARETARRAIRDGNRAAEVISRLRALFAKKPTTTEAVDLNEATREVLALSRGELQRGRATVRLELAASLPSVTGDRVQLQQVIINLLRNALDATRGVDDRRREIVLTTARDGDDHVRLSVRDSGVGFGPDGAEKLFDAFHSTKDDGMGIGLSVSRSIIASHHGRLWAIPNVGPGVTFSFSIPREPANQTHAARKPVSREAPFAESESGADGPSSSSPGNGDTPRTVGGMKGGVGAGAPPTDTNV